MGKCIKVVLLQISEIVDDSIEKTNTYVRRLLKKL